MANFKGIVRERKTFPTLSRQKMDLPLTSCTSWRTLMFKYQMGSTTRILSLQQEKEGKHNNMMFTCD